MMKKQILDQKLLQKDNELQIKIPTGQIKYYKQSAPKGERAIR